MENKFVYCSGCKESYAQNFAFCPRCGSGLLLNENAGPGPAATNYRVTLVREKNVKQRNLLFLGAVVFLSAVSAIGVVFSIFNKSLDVGSIEVGDTFAFVADIDPVTMDPAEEIRKDKKKQGGGGGGRGDRNPVQKGVAATQVEDPLFSPSKDYVRMTDPELKIRAATQGTKKSPAADEPYGLSGGGAIPSDGEGCCGGQGRGTGTGQGNDDGKGFGPGKNGGFGGGGTGLTGSIADEDEKDPPKVKKAVSQPLRIISKPRANYTDAARENMIQGKVVLKVTFLASGAIGPISVVSGLPGGLTEKAIAAARAITFEPAKADGVAVSVAKTIEYTFSIF